MAFLDGVPCSIHGIDGVLTADGIRPTELNTRETACAPNVRSPQGGA